MGCPTASMIDLAASFEAPFAIVSTTPAANFSGLSVWASADPCHASGRTKTGVKINARRGRPRAASFIKRSSG